MATTTTTSTPTGTTSTTRTYQKDTAETKTLYWLLGALAVLLVGGLIYAYSARHADTTPATAPAAATAATPTSPNDQNSPSNGAADTQRMNGATPTSPTPDNTASPQNSQQAPSDQPQSNTDSTPVN